MENKNGYLAKATIRILRPLIKMLIRFNVSHGEFAELAKQAYIDVAYQDFSIPSRKTTHARVAVLTGISRKEVMRLSKMEERDIPFTKGSVNRASRVITGWLKDSEFLDVHNTPKILPLRGGKASFEKLVARYGGDVTMGAILDELERIKAVTNPTQDTIKLDSQGYIPQQDAEEKINILSMSTADLLGTAVHNLDHEKDEARFQRQVIYRHIPEGVAREFKQYSNEKSLELLLEYNRWLDQHPRRTAPEADEPIKRIGVGIYYFEND
ncbi:MAG: DUF6502 family protein [Gammaproteobacteria bacterium]|jgi:hypothetical protein